jgi:hypothetical protein
LNPKHESHLSESLRDSAHNRLPDLSAGKQVRRPERKMKLDKLSRISKNCLGYVIRRFNASSAGLKKPVGLDLRRDTV